MANSKPSTASNQLSLNKVTLRYQDGGKIKADEGAFDVEDDSSVYDTSERILISSQSKLRTPSKIYRNMDQNQNNNDNKTEKSFISNRSNNLLKHREHLKSGTTTKTAHTLHTTTQTIQTTSASTLTARTGDTLPKKSKNMSTIVSEIMPLLNSTIDSNEMFFRFSATTSAFNKYDTISPNLMQPSKSASTTLLPRLKKSATFYPIKTLPRPYNPTASKSKVFNLVFGINNKFIEKYMPDQQLSKRNSHFLNPKLPGHLALYKLMKENTSTDLKSSSRSSLSNSPLRGSRNFKENETTANQPTTTTTQNENPQVQQSISYYLTAMNESQKSPRPVSQPKLLNNLLKSPESVNSYLSYLKNDKVHTTFI